MKLVTILDHLLQHLLKVIQKMFIVHLVFDHLLYGVRSNWTYNTVQRSRSPGVTLRLALILERSWPKFVLFLHGRDPSGSNPNWSLRWEPLPFSDAKKPLQQSLIPVVFHPVAESAADWISTCSGLSNEPKIITIGHAVSILLQNQLCYYPSSCKYISKTNPFVTYEYVISHIKSP